MASNAADDGHANMVPQSGQLGKAKSATMNEVMRQAAKPVSLTPDYEGSKQEEASDPAGED